MPAPEKWQQKLGDASVGIGNAVLSRWPIVQTATVQLPPGEAADEGRSSRGTGMTPIARDAMWTSRRGLFFLRVNAASTHIYYPHTVVDRNACGGITIRYDDGPKQGLPVHFYSHDEPIRLTDAAFESVLALREERIMRTPPQTGFWTQWEAIWKKQDRT